MSFRKKESKAFLPISMKAGRCNASTCKNGGSFGSVYSAVTYLGMRVMMVPVSPVSCLGALFALTFWPSFWPSGGFFRRNLAR